jgi:outer membrane protein TolC
MAFGVAKRKMNQYRRLLVFATAFYLITITSMCFSETLSAHNPLTSLPVLIDANEHRLSIDEALEIGYQTNFRTKRALRYEELAKLRLKATKAQYWPRFDLNLNASDSLRRAYYDTPFASGYTPETSQLQASLTGSVYMPLDIGGIIGRQVDQAELSLKSSNINVTQAEIDVGLQIRTTYIETLRAQDILRSEQAVVDDLARLLEMSQSRLPEAVPYLEVEIRNAMQSLSASKADFDQSRNALKELLRLDPSLNISLLTKLDPDIPKFDRESLLRVALENRPDLKDLNLRLGQSEISVKQVRDSRKPSANLYAYYNTSYTGSDFHNVYESNYRSYGAFLNLNIPILFWDWGVLKNNEQSAVLIVEQTKDDIEEQKERVAIELKQIIINLDQAESRLRNLPSPDLAAESLRLAEDRLLTTEDWQSQLAQVTNSRNTWRLAQTAAVSALADYYVAFFRLKRAIGEK